MRPVGTAAELERRRRRAVQLLEDGHSLATVAQRVGAAVSAVWMWQKVFREQGEASLAAKPAPGRPPKLTPPQRARLLRLLARGARAAGHPNELWSTRRIARLIEREFGVVYHPAHVSRILAECGWSWQKPERRAVERDEGGIAQWKKRRWVEIKKKARRLSAYLVFLDESGFQLLPSVRRTWAPCGQTPVVRHRYERRSKISAISAVTVSPRRQRCGLYACFHFENISHLEVAHFLRLLLRHLRGQIIVLWDGGAPHKGAAVRALLTQHSRLHVERFPAYAPELNPDEQVWGHLKGRLANGCPDTATELLADLTRETQVLRSDPHLLRGFILGSDLPPLFRS